jgi:hypothetical protein
MVKEFDAADAADVPLAFVAVTVYVNVELTVSIKVNGDEAPDAVNPLLDVNVYPVIADPPLLAAVNGTETFPAEAFVAVPIVGACGTVVAVMLDVAVDAADVAVAFVAVAVNVYAVFDCNPVMVTGDVPVPVNPPGFEVIV